MKKNAKTKRLWLVRHGEAADLSTFAGFDLDRPLTKKGRSRTKRIFKRLASIYESPDLVISSHAVRAVQTAEIVAACFKVETLESTKSLNPGCRFSSLRKVVLEAWSRADFVVLVGHEPDFSGAAARFINADEKALELKKSGVIELELNPDKTLQLTMFLPPELLDA